MYGFLDELQSRWRTRTICAPGLPCDDRHTLAIKGVRNWSIKPVKGSKAGQQNTGQKDDRPASRAVALMIMLAIGPMLIGARLMAARLVVAFIVPGVVLVVEVTVVDVAVSVSIMVRMRMMQRPQRRPCISDRILRQVVVVMAK